MKIAIEGSVIETENVYMITDIHPVLVSSGCHSSPPTNYYEFEIKFFNDKEKIIRSHIPSEEGKPKLIELRNKIISYWSDNQISIPHLKLNPDN